jgi:MYXO-CTERM domain-containing protein
MRWGVGCILVVAVAVSPVATAAAASTIYVELDGSTLTHGSADDARANVTSIVELAGVAAPFGGDSAEREAVLTAVRDDFAAFDVRIVAERPTTGEYVMAVVTPTNPFGDGVSGAAVIDCADEAGPNGVVFAFFGAGEAPAVDVASAISQEVGHSLGLEHVTDAADLLYPFATGADPYFNDDCVTLSAAAACPEQHAAYCEGADEQNSFAELLAAFGPSVRDSTPPSVEVTTPDDGDVLFAGDDLEIVVEADDDLRVDRVVLHEGGEPIGEDRIAPYVFHVSDVREGAYEIYAVAVDAAGNEAMSDVVELAAEPGGIASGGVSTGPDIARGRGTQAGCACRATPGSFPTLLLLVLAALGRRRAR